jgi:CP family cyanate transporter-like MFS transporter
VRPSAPVCGSPPHGGAPQEAGRAPRWSWLLSRWWLAFGLVLIAANLRPAVVVLSPLLPQIVEAEHLSATRAGVLNALPVLFFGLLAPMAPRLAHRYSAEGILLGALVALVAGFALRLVPGQPMLFAGTSLAGAAIAVCNVVVPGLIKRDFGGRIGLMTGLYSMALSGGAALAAGLTVPLAAGLGVSWRVALAGWGLLAVLTALVWAPQVTRPRVHSSAGTEPGRAHTTVWRSGLGWAVAAFMGLQSFNFYAVAAWLPALFVARGVDDATAGLMLALAQVTGTVASLLVPLVAARLGRQRALGLLVTIGMAVGVAGLAFLPGASVAWVVVLGASQGAGFSLSLTLIVLRTSRATEAAELSGMSQTVGYLFAATGPLVLGAALDVSGGWRLPLLVLLVALVPQGVAAARAGRAELVGGRRGIPGVADRSLEHDIGAGPGSASRVPTRR